jgi:DNA-binding protein HU-beta
MAPTTKEDLVNKIAKEARVSKGQAKQAVESMLDGIQEALVSEGKITLTGFGSFQAKNREARKGRNPQTGERITIPAKRVVKFNPGKALRDLVSG